MKLDTVINLDKWNVYAMGDLVVLGYIVGFILLLLVVVKIFSAWWRNGN